MNNNSKSGGIGLLATGIIVFILLKVFGKVIGKILSLIISIAVIAFIVFGIMIIISAIKSGGETSDKQKNSFNNIMARGRASVGQLKVLNPSIKDADVRAVSEKFTAVAEGILSKIKDDPDQILGTMQFTDYYLPEIVSILKKYQKSESAGDSNAETRSKMISNIEEITKALDAKYNSTVAGTSAPGFNDDIDALLEAFKKDDLLFEAKDNALDELEKKYS
ncbi:MAG: 5-bromo-4-chloroindolyl phosphate hydrolysis family protein [Clostridia bacterium]|nr:5-bromo-4-chloroindolyl phosphate hydrolysis family protein [Clostridia bacterium]